MEKNKSQLSRIADRCVTVLFLGFILIFIGAEFWYHVRYGIFEELPSYRTSFKLRYFDNEETPRYFANQQGWHTAADGLSKIKISFDKDGVRIPVREDFSRLESRYQIAIVGDSIPFGGAVEYEQTFAALLEEKLSDKNVLVRNFSVTDISMPSYLRKIKNQVLPGKPDMVVLATFTNDWTLSQHQQLQISTSKTSTIPKHFYPDFFIYRHLEANLKQLFLASRPLVRERFRWTASFTSGEYKESPEEWKQLLHEARWDWAAAWQKDNWPEFEQDMSEIEELVSKSSVRFLWIHFPVRPQLELPGSWDLVEYPEHKNRELAEKLDVKLVNLLGSLRKEASADIFYDHCHYTAAGHRVLADIIEKPVRRIMEQ